MLRALYELVLETGEVATLIEVWGRTGEANVNAMLNELERAGLVGTAVCDVDGDSLLCYGIADRERAEELLSPSAALAEVASLGPRSRLSSLAAADRASA